MLTKICHTIICLGKKFYLHRFVGKKVLPKPNKVPFNPPSQMVGASGAQIPAPDRGKGARNSRARAEEIKAGTNSV